MIGWVQFISQLGSGYIDGISWYSSIAGPNWVRMFYGCTCMLECNRGPSGYNVGISWSLISATNCAQPNISHPVISMASFENVFSRYFTDVRFYNGNQTLKDGSTWKFVDGCKWCDSFIADWIRESVISHLCGRVLRQKPGVKAEVSVWYLLGMDYPKIISLAWYKTAKHCMQVCFQHKAIQSLAMLWKRWLKWSHHWCWRFADLLWAWDLIHFALPNHHIPW